MWVLSFPLFLYMKLFSVQHPSCGLASPLNCLLYCFSDIKVKEQHRVKSPQLCLLPNLKYFQNLLLTTMFFGRFQAWFRNMRYPCTGYTTCLPGMPRSFQSSKLEHHHHLFAQPTGLCLGPAMWWVCSAVSHHLLTSANAWKHAISNWVPHCILLGVRLSVKLLTAWFTLTAMLISESIASLVSIKRCSEHWSVWPK